MQFCYCVFLFIRKLCFTQRASPDNIVWDRMANTSPHLIIGTETNYTIYKLSRITLEKEASQNMAMPKGTFHVPAWIEESKYRIDSNTIIATKSTSQDRFASYILPHLHVQHLKSRCSCKATCFWWPAGHTSVPPTTFKSRFFGPPGRSQHL